VCQRSPDIITIITTGEYLMTAAISYPILPGALGVTFAAAERQWKYLVTQSENYSWHQIGLNFLELMQHPEWSQSEEDTLWSSVPLMLMEMPLCMTLIAGDILLEYTADHWLDSLSSTPEVK
jgi:hypothetical protein